MNDHLWHCPCVSWMIHLAQLAFSEGGRWAKPFFICHTQKSPELLEYTYLPNPFTVLLDICCPWICVSFWACCMRPLQALVAISCRGHLSVHCFVNSWNPPPARVFGHEFWQAARCEQKLCIQFIHHTDCFVIPHCVLTFPCPLLDAF